MSSGRGRHHISHQEEAVVFNESFQQQVKPEKQNLSMVELKDLTQEHQVELASQVVEKFSQWKSERQVLENRWRECWEAYLCDVDALYDVPDEDMFKARVVRPVLYESVEGIHANLLNALMPSDAHFFSVVGEREGDHRQAHVIEAYLRKKLDEQGFSEQYGLFLKQALITGNSVAAIPWVENREMRKQRKPIELLGIQMGMKEDWQEVLTYQGPEFDVIDMFDFLIDPQAVRFEQATVIRRLTRPLHAVQSNPSYHNTADLMNDEQGREYDSHKASRRKAMGLKSKVEGHSSLIGVGGNRPEGNGLKTLYEAWGDFMIDGTVYQNYVCVVVHSSGGDHRVIRFEPNPYSHGKKPFVFTNLIPVPNEVYGIGAIEKCLGLQHAINTLTNQKLDVINISINNPFTYLVNDDVFDPDTVVTRPGALIPVKSHDTLKPIEYLNNFTVAFNEIDDLKTEVQQATGALKFLTGMTDGVGNKRTATEIEALVSGGSQKFNSFIAHLENTSLEPYLSQVFENAKQFLTEPESLRLAKEDGTWEFSDLLPELLQDTRCRFKVDGVQASLMKSQEINAMMGFIQLIQRTPELQGHVNVLPLIKKIYRRLGFHDEEQIFHQISSERSYRQGVYDDGRM